MQVADAGHSMRNSALSWTTCGTSIRSMTRYPWCAKNSAAVSVRSIRRRTRAACATFSNSCTTIRPSPVPRRSASTTTDRTNAAEPNRSNAPAATIRPLSHNTVNSGFELVRSLVGNPACSSSRWTARRSGSAAARNSPTCSSAQVAAGEQQLGAQQVSSGCRFSSTDRISSVPYTVLSPVVRNVSHCTPCGSSIQLFSLCA